MAKRQESAALAASQANAAVEARREALLDAEARGSPVLSLIAKRLRAAKKKVKRVEEIESLKASGREINSDQEEVLKGKHRNLANIEELERLFPLLREAVTEEVSQKLAAKAEEVEIAASAAAAAKAADEAKIAAEAHEIEKIKAAALATELESKLKEAVANAAAEQARRTEEKAAEEARLVELQTAEKTSVEEAVMRLLQLIYFSKLFNKDTRPDEIYMAQMEREACLSYNSTVSFVGELLTSQDLDTICAFGRLVSSREKTDIISHEEAMEKCKALALDWVNAADSRVPQIGTTVNELVVKFERITGSTYYTIKPEIKGASEVGNHPGERPEGSIPTPPGRDVNVNNSHSSNGSFPAANPPMPVVMPTANNSAFHQLLGPRPSQVTGDGQAPHEQSLPNGFIPSLTSGFSQPNSTGFVPAAGVGVTPSTFSMHSQPPGFEPKANFEPKLPGVSDADGPPQQFLAAAIQGSGSFGNFAGTDAASIASPVGSGPNQFSSAPEAPAAASMASSVPQQAKHLPEDMDKFLDGKSAERQNSYNAPPGVRPRAQPVDTPKGGRSSGRRGGQGRQGDFGSRGGGGGGRRGGPSRGFRGPRGRDGIASHFAQPVSQAGGL